MKHPEGFVYLINYQGDELTTDLCSRGQNPEKECDSCVQGV